MAKLFMKFYLPALLFSIFLGFIILAVGNVYAAPTNAPVGSTVNFQCSYPTSWDDGSNTPIEPGTPIEVRWYVSQNADLSDATLFNTNVSTCAGVYTVQYLGKQYITARAFVIDHPESRNSDPKEFTGNIGTNVQPMPPVISILNGTFPISLNNQFPESITINHVVNKPVNATSATLAMNVYDADLIEGELIINGNTGITLFKVADPSANDNVNTDIVLNTPVDYWVDGNNEITFTHTSSVGYIVNSMSVQF